MANSHSRSLAKTEVLRILKGLGLSAENIQQLQSTREPEAQEREKRKNKTGRAMGFIAVSFGFMEWWYQVITPEPNFRFGSVLLAGIVFFLVMAATELIEPKTRTTVIIWLVAVCLFVGADRMWFVVRKQNIAAKIQKEQFVVQAAVRHALTASMEYSPGDDPIRSLLIYTNVSNEDIVVTKICAIPQALNIEEHTQIGTRTLFCFVEQQEYIEAGGDGQSDPFLNRFINARLACADLIIQINYMVASIPKSAQMKQFRFVTRPSRSGFRWLREPVGSPHQYCFDKQFLAPYGNSY